MSALGQKRTSRIFQSAVACRVKQEPRVLLTGPQGVCSVAICYRGLLKWLASSTSLLASLVGTLFASGYRADAAPPNEKHSTKDIRLTDGKAPHRPRRGAHPVSLAQIEAFFSSFRHPSLAVGPQGSQSRFTTFTVHPVFVTNRGTDALPESGQGTPLSALAFNPDPHIASDGLGDGALIIFSSPQLTPLRRCFCEGNTTGEGRLYSPRRADGDNDGNGCKYPTNNVDLFVTLRIRRLGTHLPSRPLQVPRVGKHRTWEQRVNAWVYLSARRGFC